MLTLTKESFKLTEYGTYEIDGRTFEYTEKISDYGTGHLTVYRCIVDGVEHLKPIGFYKNMFGAVVNHRDGSTVSESSTNKILTDAEITAKVDNYQSKFGNLIERANKLIEVSGIEESFNHDFSGYVSAYRSKLIAENEERKTRKAENDKKSEERKMAAKVRESVSSMSDLQKELMAAVLANDFAKVAELSAKMNA